MTRHQLNLLIDYIFATYSHHPIGSPKMTEEEGNEDASGWLDVWFDDGDLNVELIYHTDYRLEFSVPDEEEESSIQSLFLIDCHEPLTQSPQEYIEQNFVPQYFEDLV